MHKFHFTIPGQMESQCVVSAVYASVFKPPLLFKIVVPVVKVLQVDCSQIAHAKIPSSIHIK